MRAAFVTVPAAIQILTFAQWAVSPGHPTAVDLHPTALTVFQVVGLRLVDVPVLGVVWSLIAISANVPFVVGAVATLLLGLVLLWVSVALPFAWRVRLLYVWGVIGALTLLREAQSIPGLLNPGLDERYLFIPTAVVGITIVSGFAAARGRQRILAGILAALLTFAVVADFRLPPWPMDDWASTSACIGSPRPCAIPEYEGWTIRWPGQGGTYRQPWP